MRNILNGDTSLDGFESLSISEKMKLYFKEMMVGIDKINAGVFNSSIHVVNTKGVISKLKDKQDYFKFSINQIPTPVFFNPNKTTFREYVGFCVSGLGLLNVTEGECDRIYDALKRVAKDGEVPFKIRSWDLQKELDKVTKGIQDNFFANEKTTRTINEIYPNIGSIEDTFNYYNDSVKRLKSRDVEIISKKVDLIIDILKLIKSKTEVGDISFNNNDILTIELALSRLSELVSTTGIVISRLNELTRVLELQVEELKRYI